MKKIDFEQALREKLRKVPFELRKRWDGGQLLVWWNIAKAEDSYLNWGGCHGDLWQTVHGMCYDLIGADAIS